MASREGIALLSMYYNDEEDEDDAEEEEQQQQQQKQPLPSSLPEEAAVMEVEEYESHNSSNAAFVVHSELPIEKSPQPPPSQTSPFSDEDWESKTLITHVNSTPTPSPVSQPQAPPNSAGSWSSEIALVSQRSKAGALNIVDYDHDETAISPEKEEGEILSVDHVMTDVEIQNTEGALEEKTSTSPFHVSTSNSQTSFDQPLKQLPVSESEADKDIAVTATATGAENSQPDLNVTCSVEILEEAVSLKEFLPPPPTTKCSQELQDKIIKFLALKKTGKSFNAELRKLKDYRNPDFLQHAVRYQGINQTGTCFNKDVFNPEGYDPSDYYDEIEADMKHEMERREQGRKRSPKVEFVSGGAQPSTAAPPKFNGIPVPSVSTVPASGQQSVSADTATRDTRPNKKSKWDKVDSDTRNPIQSGVHDSGSSGAHAGLLSASNAGAGYTAFAQQKRKEAEERRSSEKVGRR